MSVAAITWAFSVQGLRPSLKLLLVALADHAGAEGMIYPSTQALVEKTSLDRKTVIRGLDELEQASLLADTGQRTGRTGQIKVYQLPALQQESQKRESSESGTVPVLGGLKAPTFSSKAPTFSVKGSQKRDTESLREPLGTKNTAPSPLNGSFAVGEKVFDHWRQVHGHPRAVFDLKRQRLLSLALKNFSPDDLCKAIDGYKRSRWHQGENERRQVFDSIELMLRDSEHIEKGIAMTNELKAERWV